MSAIIKTSTAPLVTVKPYHEDFYGIASAGEKAVLTMEKKGKALIVSNYTFEGKPRFPSYNEWLNDLEALKAIAERKGATQQYVWKVYRACMHEVFGALPVAMDPDSIRMRDGRMSDEQKVVHDKALQEATAKGKDNAEATALAVQAVKKAKTQKKQENAGSAPGDTRDQKVSEAEMMEQFIARFGAQGVFVALDAVTRILAAEKSTEEKAKALTSIRNQLARQLKPAEKKAA